MHELNGVLSENTDADTEQNTQENMYLSFMLDMAEYGIDIRYINEVVGLQKITEVPDMPDFVRGVINLRGQVIPLIDVRRKFKMENRDYDDRTCVVIVDIDQRPIGLVVDQVKDVLYIPKEQVDPPPSIQKGAQRQLIQGIGKVDDTVKILLDIQKFLDLSDSEFCRPDTLQADTNENEVSSYID